MYHEYLKGGIINEKAIKINQYIPMNLSKALQMKERQNKFLQKFKQGLTK